MENGEEALDYLYRRGNLKCAQAAIPLSCCSLQDGEGQRTGSVKDHQADEHLKIIPVVVLTFSREAPDLVEFLQIRRNA